MFTNISHAWLETKRCPNSNATNIPLHTSQNFPTSIVNMSLGFEGFNVKCQSKQTQHILEVHLFAWKDEANTYGRVPNIARNFVHGLIAQCWPDHLLFKSLRLSVSQ